MRQSTLLHDVWIVNVDPAEITWIEATRHGGAAFGKDGSEL
jgi:hypothetical protein